MPRRNTTINVCQIAKTAALVRIQGGFTAAAEELFSRACSQADYARVIVLDMSGVEYLNSYGIALLIILLRRTRERDQSLLAFGLNDHSSEIIGLTRLDQFIRLFNSKKEALAAC
jgi:anti-sigma B factor antagonist